MEARLSGYMFQITAITPEIQAVSKRQQTEWKWEIDPKEEGKHRLHLTLTALLEIDGHSTPRAIRTFDKIIEVMLQQHKKSGSFSKTIGNGYGRLYWFQLQDGYGSERKNS